jgi:membrane associated rhomboid family serine protease
MFLYIPYGTDAPIYHRPIATVLIIVINVVAFGMFSPEQIEPYRLAMGDGLHPIQWLTCSFLHAHLLHLLGNMLFLWVFGLVVEGKLGTLNMLLLYLGLTVLFGVAVQILTLKYDPGFRLGASGVVFGLAAISFIWAPENKIYGFMIAWCFRIFIKDLETEIMILVGFFAVLQVLWSLLFDGLVGELGHIVGAVLGLIIGIMLLKANLVDCEYGDIFSVYSGAKERAEIEAKHPVAMERSKERKQERQKRRTLLIEEVELAIKNQTPLPAFIIFQRIEREFSDWTLPQDLHFKMIQQLLAGRHWEEATAAMRQYLERHQEQASFVKLMLAQVLLTQNRPKSAMDVLDNIPLQGMGAEQQSAILKIRAKADAMYKNNLAEGIYEVDE